MKINPGHPLIPYQDEQYRITPQAPGATDAGSSLNERALTRQGQDQRQDVRIVIAPPRSESTRYDRQLKVVQRGEQRIGRFIDVYV